MRLFIAAPLSDSVLDCLRRLRSRWQSGLSRARWVEPEHSHLTLAFLGETSTERASEAAEAMAQTAREFGPVELRFAGVGTFGSPAPRVVWLGLDRGAEVLVQLQDALAARLRERGFALEERKFHPHATLCRLSSPPSAREAEQLQRMQASADDAEMRAAELALFESRLTPQGPSYLKIRSCALEGTIHEINRR